MESPALICYLFPDERGIVEFAERGINGKPG
jgi:hypothetical protein